MCKLCESRPVYEFTNKREVCKICFIRYMQKKFLYSIRKFNLIKKGETIAYENKGDFRGVVLENLLEMFNERNIIEFVKMPTKKRVDKIALPFTTDIESDKFVQVFFNGDSKELANLKIIDRKFIKPLYLFLDKEILLYAKLRNLEFKKLKENKDKLSKFIEELETKHPEIKHAIVKSFLKLEY